ncbi:TetR/AcrR family transcriptional regulator [Sphingomonas insulae]|nr:TetR/AcrR family transcriptional regulator [Sphingomonas insulae]
MRTDAARNRNTLVAAAKTVFARDGAAASLDAVVREAGFGIGTLYRHFPTREALYEAVYRRDIERLVELGQAAADSVDPVEDLRRWLHAMVGTVATKKGMIAAFALAADTTSAISARWTGSLTVALDALLYRAIRTGEVRGDVRGEELLLAVVGMCMLRDQPGWQASVLRLIDTLVDGLRTDRGAQAPG